MPNSKPEALWASVDRYLNDTLIPPDPILEAALAANAAANLPAIDVSPSQGKLLQLLAETQRAYRILEIGTLGGYSTINLARALPPDGKLITLELDPHHAKVALANIAHAGLAHAVELRLGPALDSLAQLHAEHVEPFDLIFLDANKDGYPDYLTAALKLARPGTLILADNVIRDGEVIDPTSTDPNVQGVRRFFEILAADPRISSTAVQTVGSKGYDGFAIARVVSL
ncbi:O-methyltransferase [Granulicella sp. L46]|uniref:O-methyltransferase n=1 Tax=Granulicella sp. L46 TaxID=1641865 RepID=UPI00131D75D2|nr:O-methyltransferase [Granulicella sp. L46]